MKLAKKTLMRRKIVLLNLILLLMIVMCESFDYVYVDEKTFYKQLSSINNGFVAIVLKIDPLRENTNNNYASPGKIIKEKSFLKNSAASSALIQLISNISKKNKRFIGEGWFPTYEIYIKYPYRFLYLIPSEKHILILFDFKNSILFIEGRKFVFEKEAELLQTKLEYLLDNPVL